MPASAFELAVMCDTFHPLKLAKFAKDLDGDASGAGLTSHS